VGVFGSKWVIFVSFFKYLSKKGGIAKCPLNTLLASIELLVAVFEQYNFIQLNGFRFPIGLLQGKFRIVRKKI